MQSFRKRIAIQMQHGKTEPKQISYKPSYKDLFNTTKSYLTKAILIYKRAVISFEPFSEEEKFCREEILKYTIDLEILERGTHEERKEVIRKYG